MGPEGRSMCALAQHCLLSPNPTSHRPAAVQLPCFGYGKPVESLRARFRLELSDAQAAAYMRGLILGAYDKWTTDEWDSVLLCCLLNHARMLRSTVGCCHRCSCSAVGHPGMGKLMPTPLSPP